LVSELAGLCNGLFRKVTRQANTGLISWDFFFATPLAYFFDLRLTRRFLRIFLESLFPIKQVARVVKAKSGIGFASFAQARFAVPGLLAQSGLRATRNAC
jgi:hypothetical protein